MLLGLLYLNFFSPSLSLCEGFPLHEPILASTAFVPLRAGRLSPACRPPPPPPIQPGRHCEKHDTNPLTVQVDHTVSNSTTLLLHISAEWASKLYFFLCQSSYNTGPCMCIFHSMVLIHTIQTHHFHQECQISDHEKQYCKLK